MQASGGRYSWALALGCDKWLAIWRAPGPGGTGAFSSVAAATISRSVYLRGSSIWPAPFRLACQPVQGGPRAGPRTAREQEGPAARRSRGRRSWAIGLGNLYPAPSWARAVLHRDGCAGGMVKAGALSRQGTGQPLLAPMAFSNAVTQSHEVI